MKQKHTCYFEYGDIVDGRLVVPDGITDICRESFDGLCAKVGSSTIVEELVIPDSVSYIDSEAFVNDTLIVKSITLSEGNPYYYAAGGCLIEKARMLVVWASGNCVIPDSVKRIVEVWGHNIKSIVVPKSVVEIKLHAFSHLYNLESLEINANIEALPMYIVSHCRALKHIKLPDTIKVFDARPFDDSGLVSKPGIYKAFALKKGKLVCLGKRYRIGHKSRAFGRLELCKRGIHFCTNLFSVFNYYCGEYGKDFVIAECEASKKRIDTDERSCARWIKPVRILEREEVIKILNGETGD